VATLDQALAPGRQTAIGQVAVLSLILGLFWWSLHTMLKRQQRATQKIRVLADELDASAQNLARARTEFQATLDAIPDLLFELGLAGQIYDCNSRSADPLIPSGRSFLGRTVSEAMPPALATVFLAALMEANANGLSMGRQCELILDQGNRWFELSVSPKTKSPGEEPRFVALVRDITDRRAAEDQIQSLAFYDALTRLPNRRLLMDRLKHALASGTRRPNKRALLFVDLDNFKAVNDALGHDAGDLLLQQVAKRLTTCIREGDTVAHLGGDEFVVMLEELSDDETDAAMQAESVGEKILSSLGKPYQFSGYMHSGSASIGATLFGDSQENFEEPLKRSDFAMCQAKAAGRNTLRFFNG
jgi:diguanylate cyclase (GGDEF)-like protein/PAS domain S-box-containing protein